MTSENLSPTLINTFEANEARRKSMSSSLNHQENIPPLPPHPRLSTISTERTSFIQEIC